MGLENLGYVMCDVGWSVLSWLDGTALHCTALNEIGWRWDFLLAYLLLYLQLPRYVAIYIDGREV